MKKVFINIHQLLQVRPASCRLVRGADMAELPLIENAYLLVEDGRISDYGDMPYDSFEEVDEIIDCSGKLLLPTWCDSHTHLVYAGTREGEFVDRIHGLTYQEIANRGGGILNSAKKLNATSEQALYEQSKKRLTEVIKMGTGAIEIKSGYGLTLDSELKILRVIQRLKNEFDLPVIATYLAAHAIPDAYEEKPSAYVELVIQEILPRVAADELADYIDVFCELGYFSVEDMEHILLAAQEYRIQGKVHVNQFNVIGGVSSAVQCNALSVDHLEELEDGDITALQESDTMPVALPACSYFLSIPYTPARKMINAGLPLALATDYNPGSCPSGNMNFVISTACIKMNMTPEEAINAATINGAYAMGLESEVGSITRGKRANLILTSQIGSYNFIPYSFGQHNIESVYINGRSISI